MEIIGKIEAIRVTGSVITVEQSILFSYRLLGVDQLPCDTQLEGSLAMNVHAEKGTWGTHAVGNGLVLDATKSVERATVVYRLPLQVSLLLIFSTSLALWTVIFLVMGLITG